MANFLGWMKVLLMESKATWYHVEHIQPPPQTKFKLIWGENTSLHRKSLIGVERIIIDAGHWNFRVSILITIIKAQ